MLWFLGHSWPRNPCDCTFPRHAQLPPTAHCGRGGHGRPTGPRRGGGPQRVLDRVDVVKGPSRPRGDMDCACGKLDRNLIGLAPGGTYTRGFLDMITITVRPNRCPRARNRGPIRHPPPRPSPASTPPSAPRRLWGTSRGFGPRLPRQAMAKPALSPSLCTPVALARAGVEGLGGASAGGERNCASFPPGLVR